jgi:hypothetical protein
MARLKADRAGFWGAAVYAYCSAGGSWKGNISGPVLRPVIDTAYSLLCKRVRVTASQGGQVRKQQLLLRREMHFHKRSVRAQLRRFNGVSRTQNSRPLIRKVSVQSHDILYVLSRDIL